MRHKIDKKLLMLSAKVLLLRCFVVCKRKWVRFIKSIIEAHGWHRYWRVFALGLIDFFASTPFSLIIVLPLTFGSLFYILDKCKGEKIRTQIAIIFFFQFGHFVSIFWWLFVPLTTALSVLWWIIPFAILGVPLFLSLIFLPFFSTGLLIWNKCSKGKNYETLYLCAIFIICWFIGDFIRGHIIFGGFPWMMFGHYLDYPMLIQSVRVLGIDMFSSFFMALVLVPYVWIFKKSIVSRKVCFVVLVLWFVNLMFGFVMLSVKSRETFDANIAGAQANQPATFISNSVVEAEYLQTRMSLINWLSKSSQDTILLMPESAVAENLYSGDSLANSLAGLIPNQRSILMLGGLDTTRVQPYNVVYTLVDSGDITSLYKKRRLVPFGEYIPMRHLFPNITRSIVGSMVDFATDDDNDLFTTHRDLPYIYPVICYESIFPGIVMNGIKKSRAHIRQMSDEYRKQHRIKSIEERGELIINFTNDAWTKWSTSAYQHFLMTRFLAVSTGLPVVRISNNGISAFIDSCGRVHERTALNKKDVLFIPGNELNKGK